MRHAPLADRFWLKVDRSGGSDACWLWTGNRQAAGYGTLRLDAKGAVGYAHRISWELANGPVPKGAHILHTCDTPPCVNPAHLFLGDQKSNNADKQAKGRTPSGNSHYRSKLDTEKVDRLRAVYATGLVSTAELAAAFGISRQTVWEAVSGRSWKRA